MDGDAGLGTAEWRYTTLYKVSCCVLISQDVACEFGSGTISTAVSASATD